MRTILAIVVILGTGCNVFFSLDSVDPDGTAAANSANSMVDPTSCGSDCTCESDCVKTCDGACTAKCEAGACEFQLDDGGDVKCESGSDCYADCEHGNCSLDCEDGASCVLRCGPNADACDFSACSGERTSCAGKREACNADC